MAFSNHSLILKKDGTLWGCGQNNYGELGLGDTTDRTTFTLIGINTNNIKSVYCGDYHTFILKNDGTLWGCGYNEYGQLGLGDTKNRTTFTIVGVNAHDIKSVYCGVEQTFILKNDGTLWACGYNGYNQLGLGDTKNRYTFTQITTNADNVKSVSCGYYHTFILKNDGTLWGCGENAFGQLGLGNKDNQKTFTQVTTNADDIKSVHCGGRYTFILKNNSTLWGCGHNSYGQLGLGDTTTRKTFTQVTANTDNIKSVYCGNYYCTFILKNDNTLWGCGRNNYGELGLGDTTDRYTFTQITTNADNVKSVFCNYYYTLILKNDGTLYGCGCNNYGQLGLGDKTNRNTFTQITTNTNNVKCFANDYDTLSTIKIYDSKIGYTETLDTNNFRNIPVDDFEKIKVLCVNQNNTHLNCLISFDKKQTWKTFDGLNWNTISNILPENIILNGMELKDIDKLDKSKLISGGFTGDLDFKIAMKTNDVKKTPSVTKIYIEYK